jgi:hypothetical protein
MKNIPGAESCQTGDSGVARVRACLVRLIETLYQAPYFHPDRSTLNHGHVGFAAFLGKEEERHRRKSAPVRPKEIERDMAVTAVTLSKVPRGHSEISEQTCKARS